MKAVICPSEGASGRQRVVGVFASEFKVSPPMTWIDCPDDVTDRHTYEAGVFYPPAIVVPESITALQGLLALDKAGFSERYYTWAKGASRTYKELAFIEKALIWRRDDPVVAAAAAAFGLSDTDTDALFVMAAGL